MSSKNKIHFQDFFKKFQTPKSGVVVYQLNDPFLETFLKNRLKEKYSFDLFTGNEITRNLIEERFLNLSFFSSSNPIMVLAGEGIPAPVLDFLLKEKIKITEELLIILLNKENKTLVKMEAEELLTYHTLEAPKFWDGPKMLELCLQEMNYKIAPQLRETILELVENNFENFYQVITRLKLLAPEGLQNSELSVKLIHDEIEDSKVDYFKLVDVLNESPRKLFYMLQKANREYDYYLGFSLFIQGHLQKSSFPKLIEEKGKQTQYDRQILKTNQVLHPEERVKLEAVFAELELLSKMKSNSLRTFLRQHSMP